MLAKSIPAAAALLLVHALPAEEFYHLFHPVPAAQMRPMSTDRPDTTESPYTVPAGHFQLEMSFFDYSRDLARATREQAWAFGQVNLKAGLASDVDLQVIFDTYTQARAEAVGVRDRMAGFSDLTLRLKTNVWGNDEGTTAFALMPYVTIPTGTELSAADWQGGLILPFAYAISDRLNLGLMAEADIVHDAATGGHDLEWLHSATLGIGLTGELGMYVELVGIAGTGTDYQALFDCGLTFAINDALMLDAGVRIGMNRAAPDFGVFTGVSIRY